jgi:hypothetical protein
MKVTAAELAIDSNSILARVIDGGETAEVIRHGKGVAEIQRKVGVNRKELLRILSRIKFTKAETKELKKNMDVSAVFGYAGRD